MAGLLAGTDNDSFAGAGRSAAHAVRLFPIRIWAADNPNGLRRGRRQVAALHPADLPA